MYQQPLVSTCLNSTSARTLTLCDTNRHAPGTKNLKQKRGNGVRVKVPGREKVVSESIYHINYM